jgi:hypothetical protein
LFITGGFFLTNKMFNQMNEEINTNLNHENNERKRKFDQINSFDLDYSNETHLDDRFLKNICNSIPDLKNKNDFENLDSSETIWIPNDDLIEKSIFFLIFLFF